jgi:hypothetical protein
MLSGEATNTNFIVFDLTHDLNRTRGKHANHYTSDAVTYYRSLQTKYKCYLIWPDKRLVLGESGYLIWPDKRLVLGESGYLRGRLRYVLYVNHLYFVCNDL